MSIAQCLQMHSLFIFQKQGDRTLRALGTNKGDFLFKSHGHKCFLEEDNLHISQKKWDVEDNIDFKSLTRKTSRMLLPRNENTIEVSILLFTIIRNPFDLLASYWGT